MNDTILEMKDIRKSFGGVHALKGVQLSCRRGEVHILAGENGAGKSTILKILSGLYPADSGEIYFKGEKVTFSSPRKAQQAGIAMVYQELTLIPDLTVLENVFLNKEETKRFGAVDKKKMERMLRELMDAYGIHLRPDAYVKTLSVAQQQMAEILKCLLRDPELIVLDEATSALARKEVEQLFCVIRTLKERGKTVIFISHRMEELHAIGDRVTVFKDGSYVGTREIREISNDDLIRMMIGRSIDAVFPPKNDKESQNVIFSARELNLGNKLKNISLDVYKGEILGVAGLQGHGQTELMNALGGAIPCQSGTICVHQKAVRTGSAGQAIASGISLVPSDRKVEGLLLGLPIRQNLALTSLKARKNLALFIHQKKETAFANGLVKSLSIKAHSIENPVSSLSGGNQQKVVLGKAIATEPKVILFNEPTRGIDVEAKREFYNIMRSYAQRGIAVIMCSSDMSEIIGMCDRVLVMYEGGISSVICGSDISEEAIMRAAMGLNSQVTGGQTHEEACGNL